MGAGECRHPCGALVVIVIVGVFQEFPGILSSQVDTSYNRRTFVRLKMGGTMWTPGSIPWIVPPRHHYNPSRPSWPLEGTLRCSLIVDPRACGDAHNPPRHVSTPQCTEDQPAKGPPSHILGISLLVIFQFYRTSLMCLSAPITIWPTSLRAAANAIVRVAFWVSEMQIVRLQLHRKKTKKREPCTLLLYKYSRPRFKDAYRFLF